MATRKKISQAKSGCRHPRWDAATRTLWFRGEIVKCFTQPSEQQELILAAFQEQRWRREIDDPLSGGPKKAAPKRVHTVVNNLNRNQTNQLIHFRSIRNGTGFAWEPIDEKW